MPYNDAFTKMVGDTSATFKTEITAVQDNVTDEIGAPVLEGGKYKAKGDLNEIIQEIINNDVLLKAIADKLRIDLDDHANNKNNPHSTTKGQVGLGNVENYPVTSSVSDASNTKYSTAGAVKTVNDSLNSHASKTDNPHKVTKSQVGLGSVENFPFTAAVNDASDTKYATAGAVKKAYDKGVSAENGNNSTLSALNSHKGDKGNPHAVTKSQVGLGSVENFPITSAVNDSSNSKYATAGAVKQAYDKGVEGVNNANGRVSKTGDTMTGTLTANGGITIGTDQLIQFNRNSDWFKMGFKNTADGDTDSYGYIEMGDNGNEYFKFRSISGGTITDLLTIKTDHARWKGNVLYHTGNKPSANDVGLGDAWKNSNTSFSKSGNGYIKFPNGLIIQWGTSGTIAKSGRATINLPLTFPSECTSVVAGVNSNYIGGGVSSMYARVVSVSQIEITHEETGVGVNHSARWIAIGY